MSSSSSPPFGRRRKSWARRIERCCCGALSYFPLTFVYGLLTWAAWVEVSIGFWPNEGKWTGKTTSLVGFILYALAASSYTVAVSKDPGSPITSSAGQGYSALPRHETPIYTSLTAKSSGKPRYCKKCHTVKPDRAHHCSSCNRCVLKMDHHCPWLATCVGMYNYKAFILFLSYTTLFSWLCFATATEFVWRDIFDESKMEEGLRIVNVILLAVLGGIIGLVLGGFTAWHVYLATDGKTTIESLEKTRYLNPLKKSMENQVRNHSHSHSHNHNHNDARHYLGDESTDEDERTLGEQLKEIHANALPGVTRPEEGETRTPTPSRSPHSTAFDSSPASDALRRNYASLEADRERERYSAYLDEQDSEKLPHAFDLGWRRNLLDLFGPKPLYWFLPICNTKGDGWTWEVSANWSTKRDELAADRALREEAERRSWRDYQAQRQQWHGGAPQGAGRHFRGPPSAAPQIRENHSPQPEWSGEQDDTEDVRYLMTTNGVAHVPLSGRRSPGKAEQLLGKSVPPAAAFSRRKVEDEDEYEYDTSSDDEEDAAAAAAAPSQQQQQQQRDWNDVPEEFLTAPGRSGSSRYHRDRSGGRTKGD